MTIVDFFHAADRLRKVGRALYHGVGEQKRARAWSKRWIGRLHKGKAAALSRANPVPVSPFPEGRPSAEQLIMYGTGSQGQPGGLSQTVRDADTSSRGVRIPDTVCVPHSCHNYESREVRVQNLHLFGN